MKADVGRVRIRYWYSNNKFLKKDYFMNQVIILKKVQWAWDTDIVQWKKQNIYYYYCK